MAVSCRGLVALALSLVGSRLAAAEPEMCRVINVDFTPGGIPARAADPEKPSQSHGPDIQPQIVGWLETTDGKYLDTVFITQQTGRFGLGNRPGRYDFNSGPNWPYGRRTTVFPVWAHRHPMNFPQLEFQSGGDDALSHRMDQSSSEVHYCKPLHAKTDMPSWDAATCPSAIYTDKGIFGGASSKYPPRIDVKLVPGTDSSSVAMFKAMNPLDAVSQATPALGAVARMSWTIPSSLPMGDYVLFMEVALEQDFNESFPAASRGPDVSYGDYGVPYLGQPSVVYRVPVTVTIGDTFATTDRYIGYSDPTGADGAIRPPDPSKISETVPNSGASRLLLTSSNGEMFRVKVNAHIEQDHTPPSEPSAMAVTDVAARTATLSFLAPGDDGDIGPVAGYEVRYMVGDAPIDETNFADANEMVFNDYIAQPGQMQTLQVKDLLPDTQYEVAVRAYDNCHNTSKISSTSFITPARKVGEVDACFVATAAYGSLLANDVELLRRFRDMALRRSVLGELLVETYYTFGPSVAGVVGESELLRTTARDVLGPMVSWVRRLHW